MIIHHKIEFTSQCPFCKKESIYIKVGDRVHDIICDNCNNGYSEILEFRDRKEDTIENQINKNKRLLQHERDCLKNLRKDDINYDNTVGLISYYQSCIIDLLERKDKIKNKLT